MIYHIFLIMSILTKIEKFGDRGIAESETVGRTIKNFDP